MYKLLVRNTMTCLKCARTFLYGLKVTIFSLGVVVADIIQLIKKLIALFKHVSWRYNICIQINLPFSFCIQEPFSLLLLHYLHHIRLLDLISFQRLAPPCILWWCRSLPQDGACAFRRCEFVFSEPECQNTMINKDWAHSIIAESTYIALTSSIVSSS